MTLLTFVAFCAIGALVSLAGGSVLVAVGRPRTARGVEALALAAAVVAALRLAPGETLAAGDANLAVTWFAGFFVTAGLTAALALFLVAPDAARPRGFVAASLTTFALLAVSLSVTDSGAALLVAAAAGAPILAVSLAGGHARSGIAISELRTVALLVAASLLAAMCVAGAAWTENARRVAPVAAYLLLALATAVRAGAVPFHVPAAHLSRESKPLVLAIALVWVPAGFTAAALSWTSAAIPAGARAFDVPSLLVVCFAVATLLLGAVGALLHDDLREVATYSISQDSAFLLLALGIRDAAVADQARLWLLAYLLGKTALVAWVVGMHRAFGTTHLTELAGWARRAPLLAAALVAIAAASIGWPGFAVYDARSAIVGHSLVEPFALVGAAATLLSLAVYVRLLGTGLLAPSASVAEAQGDAIRRPALAGGKLAGPVAGATGAFDSSTTDAEAAPATPDAGSALVRVPWAARAATASKTSAIWSRRTWALVVANSTPTRHALLLGVAIVAAAVAFGGLGASRAVDSGWVLRAATASPTPIAPGGADGGAGGGTETGPGALPPDAAPSDAAPGSTRGAHPSASTKPSHSAPAGTGSATTRPTSSGSTLPGASSPNPSPSAGGASATGATPSASATGATPSGSSSSSSAKPSGS